MRNRIGLTVVILFLSVTLVGSYLFAQWFASKAVIKNSSGYTALGTALKAAFPEMSAMIGERSTPTVTQTAAVDKYVLALVNMGTGGAYTDYYTVVRVNGKSSTHYYTVIAFECGSATVSPRYFASGSSLKHQEVVGLVSLADGSVGLHHLSISRSDEGNVDELDMEFFLWDGSKGRMVCSPELSARYQIEGESEPATFYSWDNPVPINKAVTASYTFGLLKAFPSTVELRILKLERIGEQDPRYDMILRTNSDLKVQRKPGYEFLVAKVGFKYVDGTAPEDQQFMLNPLYMFAAYSSDKRERYATMQNYPTGLTGLLVAKHYYVEGYVAFYVRSEDKTPRIGLLPDQTKPSALPTIWFQGW